MTLDAAQLGRIAFGMALGAVGGVLASEIGMPLPWMLGPMCVCTLAAVMKLPIGAPMRIRPAMVLILGVMLGSGFRPEMMKLWQEWSISLLFLAGYVLVVGLLAYPYFRKFAGYDRVTAYFAGMPGGLNEMMIVGGALGGDERRIVLTHACRILLTVLAIPIWFRLTTDIDMTDRSKFGVALDALSLEDYAILGACALVGWPVGKLLRVPAPMLVGPMLISAAVHLAGLSQAQPPLLIVNLAQWVLGTVIGCRFIGVARKEIGRVMAFSVGSTAIMIAVTVAFAVLLEYLTGQNPATIMLAYAPGGLAEMSLVALALGADVAFVASHHVIRIVMVVIAAPMFFRVLGQRDSEAP